EDGAAVLRADIVALPVELGGIMSAKEDIEHFGIRDHAGIVGHADRLGMASRAAAHLLVGGVRHRSADVAAFDFAHSDHVAKYCLGAPEAPAGEDCRLFGHCPFSFAG